MYHCYLLLRSLKPRKVEAAGRAGCPWFSAFHGPEVEVPEEVRRKMFWFERFSKALSASAGIFCRRTSLSSTAKIAADIGCALRLVRTAKSLLPRAETSFEKRSGAVEFSPVAAGLGVGMFFESTLAFAWTFFAGLVLSGVVCWMLRKKVPPLVIHVVAATPSNRL